jgi:hypothetical protein
MAMKTLEYLRGISPEDCRKLRERGIRHTNQLLHVTTLGIDRQRLSSRTGISADRLLELGRQCALLEISGMERYLPVIRRLGLTSLKDLRQADAGDLHTRVVDAVGMGGAPARSMVEYWVGQARTIDTMEDPESEHLPAQWESPSVRTSPGAAAAPEVARAAP